MKFQTENVRPPIPIRSYDWRAYLDDREDGPQGWGATEAEAIAELQRCLDDDHPLLRCHDCGANFRRPDNCPNCGELERVCI